MSRLLKMAWPVDLDADLKADANTKNKIMVRVLLDCRSEFLTDGKPA